MDSRPYIILAQAALKFFFGFFLIFLKIFFLGLPTLGHPSLGKIFGFNHAFNRFKAL